MQRCWRLERLVWKKSMATLIEMMKILTLRRSLKSWEFQEEEEELFYAGEKGDGVRHGS